MTWHDDAARPYGMLINIMVATVAADPTVALKPCGHLAPIGFRLRHGYLQCTNICASEILVQPKMRN
jgi:hypothetical protein